MPRLMYDAVNPSNIPATAEMVAGYVDGAASKWPLSGWTRFFGRPMVRITVLGGSTVADVVDVERGDVTPAGAAVWVRKMQLLGRTPAVYCSRSSQASVLLACYRAKVSDPLWWLADWTNKEHLPPGTIATQWTSTAGYDLSTVADYWPGVDPTQKTPTASEVDGMRQVEVSLRVAGNPARGWIASPFPAASVVSALAIAPTPDGGRYYDVPTLAYITTAPGPASPNGVLVFEGGIPGPYAVQVTAVG